MTPRPRLLLVLPVLAALAAVVVLGLGTRFARSERIERVLPAGDATGPCATRLAAEVRAQESRYEAHLEALSRHDLDDTFGFAAAAESIVGIRQVSLLSTDGQNRIVHVARGLRAIQDELPVPVLSEKDLPWRRHHPVLAPALPPVAENGTAASDGTTGWWAPEGSLFFFRRLSDRRTLYLLVDPEQVRSAIVEGLGTLATILPEPPSGGGLILTAANRPLLTRGSWDDPSPDLVHRIGSRFGDWEIRSRDPRRTVVSYQTLPLVASGGIAAVLALGGLLTFLHLGRALRLAEQRVSFANRVSHELKTPLTNILLNTDLALDGADPRSRRRLSLVREEAERLSRLIDNVLSFSKKNPSRRVVPEPFCLFLVAGRVVESFRPALERRGVRIHFEGGATFVLGDPDAFSQILGNLLSNVEKYAAGGGRVDLRVFSRTAQAVVQVEDAGPGIAEADRERVFAPFERLDHRTVEGVSGTGLGLSIARDLAANLGGALRLHPASHGTGCLFELTLPEAGSPEKILPFPPSMAS